jgi:4-hydroxythreonine-4-phosphate dehydrogenase
MKKVRVGITMGDPCGIGPEIIAKAVRSVANNAEFIIIGDRWLFDRFSVLGFRFSVERFIDLKNVDRKNFKFGKVRPEYGKAAIEYLDKALELIKNKQIDCLVTCPISKEAINLAGFGYSGHTEYFSKKTHAGNLLMMLLNKHLKIGLVTRHIRLKDVSGKLSPENLGKTITLTHQALKELFLIKQPRIVVCGLNPHASDNGLIGDEENRIIKPVVKKMNKKLRRIFGPESADTAVTKAMEKEYDAVIAIYHDQALIPLKLTDAGSGVNLTVGLDFIRTSPLHGTAFDIAGKNIASPSSLIAAINLAIKCSQNQKRA